MEAKVVDRSRESFRTRVRRRLIRAIAGLHPEVEIVRVKATPANDAEAGERWVADERGKSVDGAYDAYLVILKKPSKKPWS